MGIFLLLIIHWYASLFFQSVFHHRYAAHGLFTMSRGWERTFFVGCFITQGSSYISARTYGIMHRLHHAHTDKPEDPHSPENTPNLFAMMWDTRNNYKDIHTGKTEVAEKYKKNLPQWDSFDRFAHSGITKALWVVLYIALYMVLATEWWHFLFLPLTLAMGAFQGAVVNWWAHRFGYANFKMDNTSRNILPFDLFFWGEAYHNNHHRHPSSPNNAHRWFEWDMGYFAMRTLHRLQVIRLVKE
ncbi:MAG: fatty acid desaturase [Flavipsychrobacter sp.]|nr:fatty acid desaturase [Flavipsychrobacter sp.]